LLAPVSPPRRGCAYCVFSEKDGGSLIMGVLVRGLRSADWMPDRESELLNGECCCGIAVGDVGRESAFRVERRERGLLRRGSIDCGRL
jgi:hypothetical protein